jgi:septum formation protein
MSVRLDRGPAGSDGRNPRFVLASASPRRRRLLELIKARHHVHPSEVDETPFDDEPAAEFAGRAACDKASDVAVLFPDAPVLGADTVVEIDGEILGKPDSPEHALEMLRRLSGRTHRVHTGVALVVGGAREHLVDSAAVHFADVDDQLISWYVATGEPLDKAGAYAVQGCGGVLVSAIEGSPHTVIGLPLHLLPALFSALDLDFWDFVIDGR